MAKEIPDTSVTERVARIEATLNELAERKLLPDFVTDVRAAIFSMPALEEENARLREALREIAGNTWSDWTVPRDKARAALTSTREGLSTGGEGE